MIGTDPGASGASPPAFTMWWARNDLRLLDNPVLKKAAASVEGVDFFSNLSLVYVFDPYFLDTASPIPGSRNPSPRANQFFGDV